MVMHRCSGSEELYYWDINCFDGYKDCPNGEDESRANPICADRKHHNLNHCTVPYLTIFKLRLSFLECYKEGVEYTGVQDETKHSYTCMRWDATSPHVPRAEVLQNLTDSNHNYCRNPDNDPKGPWCYTTDPNKRFQYCNIPSCDAKECYNSGVNGYLGRKAVTKSGYTCQKWSSDSPHYPQRFPKAVNHNYCRLTTLDDSDAEPWCYTTNPNVIWEACDIPKC